MSPTLTATGGGFDLVGHVIGWPCLIDLSEFDIGDEPVLVLVEIDLADPLDGLLHGRHFFLRCGFQGPRVGIVTLTGFAS